MEREANARSTFAEKLKQLREAVGLTQAQLAQKTGLSLGVVRDHEQGRKEPAMRSAFKLAAALGVSCEAFKGCINEPPPEKPATGKATKGRPAGKGRGRKRKGE